MRARAPSLPAKSTTTEPFVTHRFIVIEGNNGVGKSTVAAHLETRLGAALFHYPPAFIRFRDEVEMDEQVPPWPNLVYHLGGTLHLSEIVTQELGSRHVVCDRYLPGPLSLLRARHGFAEEDMIALCAPFEPGIRKPDVTVLLTASHAKACERIRGRARGGALRAVERWVLASSAFFQDREASLRHHASRMGPLIEVSTTALSAEEASAVVTEQVCLALGLGAP